MNSLNEIFDKNEMDIPAHTLDGLRSYLVQRITPGDFIRCVLEGDLFGAVQRADHQNQRAIRNIVNFVQWYFPGCSFGSRYTVVQWLNPNTGKPDDPGKDQNPTEEAVGHEPPPGPEVTERGNHPSVNGPSDPGGGIGEDAGDPGRFAERIGSGSSRQVVGESIMDELTRLWEQWENGKRELFVTIGHTKTAQIASKMERTTIVWGQLFSVAREFIDRKGPFA